jgi:NitT/TauT family transport system permease protein
VSRAPRWLPRILPLLVGSASVVAVFALIELLLHLDVLNRFIIPFPSDVVLSLWRVIVEEDVPGRFLLTAGEALGAGALVAGSVPASCSIR